MKPIARAGFERIAAYRTGPLPGVDLDLRDNVNLWGAPPRALAAVHALESTRVSAYPSVSGGLLVETLAQEIGAPTATLVAGCGSDDLIDACFRAVAAPGERVAYCAPTFAMVPVFAALNGLEAVAVPPLATGGADVDALLATGARIIYLCSPNNPTGAVTPESEIRRLVERAPGIVLLDEAYAEFAGKRDWRAEVPAMERLLLTRTFSKAWGLAGLRVGYGIGGAALVGEVEKARGPYKVSAAAEAAAVAAIRGDGAWMRAAAHEASKVRDQFAAALQGRLGVRAWPSRGNFAFLEVADRAADLAARFQARGVGVRAFSGLPGIGEALRIGVAPTERFARVFEIAQEIWP